MPSLPTPAVMPHVPPAAADHPPLPDRPPQDWPRLGPAAQRAIEGWEAEVEAERRPAMEAEYIEKVGGRQMRLAAAWLLCGPAGAF